ncbi:winged helix-turn-helix domain-containing protein [Methanococcus maripaludis]|jgi:DNA-binding HxlR family transcriptional regulator|uniref:Helix-turn-helix transcriptional regulator n=3 Tax=Methanococcus maripaludis TaxID=39152 RepID=A0A8T3VXA6_METMI|nr:helix-turn-helix domain-containing protein [Methanococcus maripaludis]AEK19965.1 hypothetical protein GYY_05500 [Methanococcus maripaludis X1]MBG0768531.1 helix-turn-helix transcriptional regulator [Methanococcus maripaludis]MDK2928996.1 hypothetical protein [Methanococcus sp.]BAP61172.1 hypothetical protein MMKA1_10550 [Methanococcus maripaludis KA1]
MFFELISKKHALNILQEINYQEEVSFGELKNTIGINQSNLSKLLSEFVKYDIIDRIERKEGNQTKVFYCSTVITEKLLYAYDEFITIENLCIIKKEAFENYFTDDIFENIKTIPETQRYMISPIKPEYVITDDLLGKIYIKVQPTSTSGDKLIVSEAFGVIEGDGITTFTTEIDDLSNGNHVYIFCGSDLKNGVFKQVYLIPIWEIRNTALSKEELTKWEVKSKQEVYDRLIEYKKDLAYIGTISIPGQTVDYCVDEITMCLYAISNDKRPKLLGKLLKNDEGGEFACSLDIGDKHLRFDSNYAKDKEKSIE